jgi:hypothetical protein
MNGLIPELRQFVQRMQLQNYDLLIPIERKGMALMRILLQDQSSDIGLDPNKLLSSDAIEYLDPKWLINKKACVFDDTLFTGQKMSRQIKDLEDYGAKADSSAFAVCGSSTFSPTFRYYDNLSYQDYTSLRLKILNLISESQILLLDTEHIGLRVNCELSSSEIMERLCNLGGPLIKARLGRKDSEFISIHEPPFFNEFILNLPEQNNLKIFRKLRFLIQDGSMWIVPIVYPPTLIPTSNNECPTFKETNDRELCLCQDYPDESIRPLYCRGLYLSAHLLAVTLKRLKKIMIFNYDLSNERNFPLENLKALFPMLNIQKWRSWLIDLISATMETEDINDGEIKIKYPIISIGEQTDRILRHLLNALLEHYDRAESERVSSEYIDWVNKDEFAISYNDLFNLFPNTPDYLVSQALDILIDQSRIIPTEKKTKIGGKSYWIRGARLDGEYTYHLARMARKSLRQN